MHPQAPSNELGKVASALELLAKGPYRPLAPAELGGQQLETARAQSHMTASIWGLMFEPPPPHLATICFRWGPIPLPCVPAFVVVLLLFGCVKPKNTQNGKKSRFPGATCIFSKCCERQKRTARNSASDGQKYRAFWSP